MTTGGRKDGPINEVGNTVNLVGDIALADAIGAAIGAVKGTATARPAGRPPGPQRARFRGASQGR
jgi:hypothetical protein